MRKDKGDYDAMMEKLEQEVGKTVESYYNWSVLVPLEIGCL